VEHHSSGFRKTAKSVYPKHASITGIQGQDIQSCFCNNDTEHWKHILTCESMDVNLNHAASWAKLNKSMEAWYLPHNYWIALENGIARTTNQAGTPTNIPLPFTISINTGYMQLWE
jgi:hypothetical protein